MCMTNVQEVLFEEKYWQILETSGETFYLYSAFFGNRVLVKPVPQIRVCQQQTLAKLFQLISSSSMFLCLYLTDSCHDRRPATTAKSQDVLPILVWRSSRAAIFTSFWIQTDQRLYITLRQKLYPSTSDLLSSSHSRSSHGSVFGKSPLWYSNQHSKGSLQPC